MFKRAKERWEED